MKGEPVLSLMGNPGSLAPLRLTESHGRGFRGPTVCQAPPKALSHTLNHHSFTNPNEEGSLVHCQGSKKANESQLGLCGDRGDPGPAHEHVILEKKYCRPRGSLSGRGWDQHLHLQISRFRGCCALLGWHGRPLSPFHLLIMLASIEAGQVGMW